MPGRLQRIESAPMQSMSGFRTMNGSIGLSNKGVSRSSETVCLTRCNRMATIDALWHS